MLQSCSRLSVHVRAASTTSTRQLPLSGLQGPGAVGRGTASCCSSLQKWLQQLQAARVYDCSSVLRACVNLSKEQVDAVWAQTWTAFMQHVRRLGKGLLLRDTANAVYAAAELRRQPDASELQLLVQASLQPGVLQHASSQDIVDCTWALNQLLAQPGWQEGLSKQAVQQLLDQQQRLGQEQAQLLLARQISSAATLAHLSDVSNQQGGSFKSIHAAFALNRFAKLSSEGQRDSRLQQQLVHKWLLLLPKAGVVECSTVLQACTHLSREQVDTVWGQTWAAFMQHVQQGSGQGLLLQDITNAVHAAAQLHRPPGAGELQQLLQASLQSDMPGVTSSQDVVDLTWALNQLLAQPGWQEGLSKQAVQQLLDQQQRLGEQLADRLIAKQTSSAVTLAQLADVSDHWGGSFKSNHTAAALTRFAQLSNEGQRHGGRLLQLLVRNWVQLLPGAGAQECYSTLWACVNLSTYKQHVSKVWGPTLAAYMQHVQQQSKEALVPQQLANLVQAAAELRKQPAAGELHLVRAFLRQDVLATAGAHAPANFVGALGRLSQSPGWQGGVSERDMQQLLGKQQLQLVAAGSTHAAASVMSALAPMATADPPLISRAFAQRCAMQLLSLVSTPVSAWGPHAIASTMWGMAKLGLPADFFVQEAVATAEVWVPNDAPMVLQQAALACAMLQYRDEAFLSLLLQRGSAVLRRQQQQQTGKARSDSRVLSANDRISLAATLAASVSQLEAPQLAGAARELVVSSGAGRQANPHPANLRRLWLFHTWLLQHQLLDGRGLAGLVPEQLLQQGAKEAAVHGTGVRVQPWKDTA